MSDTLPPLPEPTGTVEVDCGPAPGGGREVMYEDAYSADQMRAYALAARQQAQVPEGWRAEVVSDDDVRLYDPSGESWLLRSGQDGFWGFAHRLATALAAAPQAATPEPSPDASDLAMMLRRCASALKAEGRETLALAAMGLLERKGLQGSPLRGEAAQPEPKPCLVSGDCKHGNWCSEVYCQEHCKFVEPEQAQQSEPFEAWFKDYRHGWKSEKDVAADAWQAAVASILARLEAVPMPRKWPVAGSHFNWISGSDFDDYHAAMLAAAKGDTK